MSKEKLIGPTVHRAAVGIEVLDADKRSVRLSFSSDAPYLRASWFDDPWIEILGHDAEEVDMGRLEAGAAPLLWGHDAYDRDNHIGVVEKAWLEKGKGYADVRLSGRADLADLWADVASGIVRNVSVGYKIHERVLVRASTDGPSEYRVTRWEPVELSLVSVPADPGVGVGRSADPAVRFTITPLEIRSMSAEITDVPVPTPAAPAAPVVDANQIRTLAMAEERTRISDIHTAVRAAGLAPEFGQTMIDNGTSIDAARAAVIAEMAKHKLPAEPRGPVTAGPDQVDKQRAAAADWLLGRSGVKVDGKPINLQGNDYRGMTLLDLAKDRLTASGQAIRGLDAMEIAKRAIAHSTSDFPVILGNVFNKVLLSAYGIIPDTWRRFVKVGSVSDFRQSNRYRAGTFGDLDTIPEGGEYKYGTIGDAELNTIQAQTKGKMFSVTRQLLINDDLGALVGILQLMGRGAARTVEKDIYAALLSNSGAGPTMTDTGNLFNSTAVTTAGGHANLLASGGSAPSVASIAAMKIAMMTQSYGGDYIDVPPTIFLGPVDLAEAVKVLNDSQFDPADNKFQKPNQVRGFFTDIIGTPRLTGTAWYTFADPDVEPVLEIDFLNGNQTPYTEQREGWNVDGIEYKVRMDYGIAAVGFRGARKNPGA